MLVDTEGFVLKAKVHSAKVMDYEGIKTLLRQADRHLRRLSHLWLDAGYRGEDKGKDWVQKTLGWSVDLLERLRQACSQRGAYGMGQGMGQRRREGGLAEAVAP